jgi:putative acetyltransferase
MTLLIRPQSPSDDAAVRAVLHASFPTPAEARLVDLLRAHGKILADCVAEVDGRVVGCILFSPVEIVDPPCAAAGAGLAPLAVLPFKRKQGIGSRLVREGLDACRRKGLPYAVVLGDPSYYRRFGFEAASRHGLRNEYGVDEEFRVLELAAGRLPGGGGLVKYAPEFAEMPA